METADSGPLKGKGGLGIRNFAHSAYRWPHKNYVVQGELLEFVISAKPYPSSPLKKKIIITIRISVNIPISSSNTNNNEMDNGIVVI